MLLITSDLSCDALQGLLLVSLIPTNMAGDCEFLCIFLPPSPPLSHPSNTHVYHVSHFESRLNHSDYSSSSRLVRGQWWVIALAIKAAPLVFLSPPLFLQPMAAPRLCRPSYCSLTLCPFLWLRPLTPSRKHTDLIRRIKCGVSSVPRSFRWVRRGWTGSQQDACEGDKYISLLSANTL